jgi:hypothetical protein
VARDFRNPAPDQAPELLLGAQVLVPVSRKPEASITELSGDSNTASPCLFQLKISAHPFSFQSFEKYPYPCTIAKVRYCDVLPHKPAVIFSLQYKREKITVGLRKQIQIFK